MNDEFFLEKVRERGALTSPEQARAVAEATLEALGEQLFDRDRIRLAEALPAPFGEALRRGAPGQDFGLDDFYRRVQRREGVAPGFGVEHAQAVCLAIAAALGEELTVYLVRRLPDEFAPLFRRRRLEPTVPPDAHHAPQVAAGYGRTLSTGRFGSRDPLAEHQRSRG
jgi:uncharacterized protein (DUF2267 family)